MEAQKKNDQQTMKVRLYFPPESTAEPIAYRLVKEFDLTFNILNAEVTLGKKGRLTLELTGTAGGLEKALGYLHRHGIETRIFAKNIIWSEQRCVSCGACTGVCPSGALHMSQQSDWSLCFDDAKCLVCEACVKACPLRAIDVDVFG